jgi:hypothetical protein
LFFSRVAGFVARRSRVALAFGQERAKNLDFAGLCPYKPRFASVSDTPGGVGAFS